MESDCLQVIEACRNNSPTHEIAIVVEDILAMRSWFSSYALLWTPREANELAHQVAHLSLEGNLSQDWVPRVPPMVDSILRKESHFVMGHCFCGLLFSPVPNCGHSEYL